MNKQEEAQLLFKCRPHAFIRNFLNIFFTLRLWTSKLKLLIKMCKWSSSPPWKISIYEEKRKEWRQQLGSPDHCDTWSRLGSLHTNTNTGLEPLPPSPLMTHEHYTPSCTETPQRFIFLVWLFTSFLKVLDLASGKLKFVWTIATFNIWQKPLSPSVIFTIT